MGSFCNGVEGKKFGKVDSKLKNNSKGVVTTIKAEYGDIYDCVDIHKQPALDHPTLANHKIQVRPGKELEDKLARFRAEKAHDGVVNVKIGLEKGCPPGTVPIRKLTHKKHARARSSSQKLQFHSLWNHGLEADNHQSTGCYNTLCSGFVHVNDRIPLDYVFPNISLFMGIQFEIYFILAKVDATGDWWFLLNESSEYVGYWPKSIFTSLSGAADTMRWGGQIFTPSTDGASPQMGNGHFENGQYRKTCHMSNIRVINATNSPVIPDNSWVQTVDSRCYYARDNSYKPGLLEYSFLFGGVGGKNQGVDGCIY
ncbi:hypothetical protein L1049_026342 [Liquidambar formosana]|uniref:Neprosin PEP catalytic domain-containing protein n=1 Tax=Liquidambar formosana TaxID=63359 RepID=A0AAP0NG82_LIQFO